MGLHELNTKARFKLNTLITPQVLVSAAGREILAILEETHQKYQVLLKSCYNPKYDCGHVRLFARWRYTCLGYFAVSRLQFCMQPTHTNMIEWDMG